MKSISKKAKKSIVITSIAVVCIGIVSVVIVNANSKVKATNDKAIKNSSATIVLSSDVTPNSIKENVASGSGKAFDPKTESSRSEPLTSYSKSSSTPSKPVVEGDSKNGSQPTNPALTNKSQKPTYTTPPKASTKKNTTTKKSSSKSSTPTKKSSSSSTSVSKKGKIYVPGFGWVKDNGGGGQETTVGNSGDELTGDKVGIMD